MDEFTVNELIYLRACLEVADEDNERAKNFGCSYEEVHFKLTELIEARKS